MMVWKTFMIILLGGDITWKNRDKQMAQLQQELRLSPDNLHLRKRLGELLFQSGMLSEAVEHLEKIIEKNENVPDERYLLATAYYQLGEWEKAKLAIGKIEKTRRAGKMYLLLSKIYMAEEDFISAETCYDLAIEFDGSLVDLDYEQEFFEPVMEEPNSDALEQLIEDKLQRAEDASDARHYDLAIEILYDVIAIDPDISYAYHMLAVCYFQKDEYEQGNAQIEKAIQLEPDNFGYYTLYGYYLKILERYMEAKKAIETALAIDPNHSFTYNIYADLFLELNQAEEAKKQALKALELEPEQKNGYVMLGLANSQLEIIDEAEDAFLKGLQLSPKDFECNYHYGEFLLLHKKDPEQAIVHLKEARQRPTT
jgi:tetratricopeptide (TPR) repeat protein